MPGTPSKLEKGTASAAVMLEMLGKLLQGTSSPTPQQQTAPRSGAVPNVAGGPPTSTGAPRQFPNFVASPMPLPSQPQPPGTMQTGLEFRTPEAAKGAVASGMLANIAGAISDWKTEKVKKEHFQVGNTIAMLQALFQSGDPDSIAAAKSMLGDEKTIRSLDKYLTGGYPRLPAEQKKVQQPESPGASTGMEMVGNVGMAEPGKAGGPWMPSATPMAQMKAQAEQKLQQALSGQIQLTPEDRQLIGLILGPQAAQTPEKYAQTIDIGAGLKADANTVSELQTRTDINLKQLAQGRELFILDQAERTKQLSMELASREKVASAGDATQLANARIMRDANLGILPAGVDWKKTMQGHINDYNRTKDEQSFARNTIATNTNYSARIQASIAQALKVGTSESSAQIELWQTEIEDINAQNDQFRRVLNVAGANIFDKVEGIIAAEKARAEKEKNKKKP